MTARMYYDNDADPSALEGQTVAVIGYGSQGHAHALNLHECGVDVIVGLAPGSKSRALAEEAGLRVFDVAEAVQAADVIMIVVPDTGQKAVYDTEIEPNLQPGSCSMFAHGFNIQFGRIAPPDTIDVGMVAPKGPGHLLRSVYRRAAASRRCSPSSAMPRARRVPASSPTPARSARPVPASSRRRSPRRPRPTCSASSRCCAAARRPS